MEMIKINAECASAFHKLIREDAYPFLMSPDVLGLGLVDNNEAVGASLLRADTEGGAEILSICVAGPYRRKGLGTELLVSAADFLTEEAEVGRFRCRFNESIGEEGFRMFLKYLDFDISETGSACYKTSSKKLSEIPILQQPAAHVTPYREMTMVQKKQLYGERMDLKPFMDENLVDENLSCVRLRDGQVAACLIFVRDYQEGSLVLQWANNPGKVPADLLRVFRYAAGEAKRYPNDIPIYVPALNLRSSALSARLLHGICEKTEQGYTAELELLAE